jgi:hypothetical protein
MSQRGSIHDPRIQTVSASPNTKGNICQEQLDLLTAWADAARAASATHNHYDLSDNEAQLRCAMARKMYDDHIEQHGCCRK